MTELDATTRRLDRLFFTRGSQDFLLQLLLGITTGGLPFPVGLVVAGTIIRGAIATPDTFAVALDSAVLGVVNELYPKSPEDPNTGTKASEGDDLDLRTVLNDTFANTVRRLHDLDMEGRKLTERYAEDAGLDDFESQDVVPILRAMAPHTSFELKDAQISLGGVSTNVGVIRVRVSDVSAWWPLHEEPSVNLRFSPAPR